MRLKALLHRGKLPQNFFQGRHFMPNKDPATLNIGLVGGGAFCEAILEKAARNFQHSAAKARIVAVAEPDSHRPAILRAEKLGLLTVQDYHELYLPEHQVHVIMVLTPDRDILEDILQTKPPHIQVQPYDVFDLFWEALGFQEKQLKERSQEIETILNGIQDLIVLITPEMEIVEVNQAFLDQMGYLREEVIGRKCHEVFQKINRQCNVADIACPLNTVIRNKKPSQQVLTRVDHDGHPHYIEVTIFPIWEKDGKISKFIEISRDITERKREEEEITGRLEQMVEDRTRALKETHAKLLHQDKMASLGKLSASVVHEINNPISGILNLTMLMQRVMEEGPVREKDAGRFREYLKLMETETRRISRIVSNLLTFSRQSRMELRGLDINQLIEKTLFLNANLLKIHSITVDKKLDPKLPDLIGSEDQLQQVFMNLISNAAEAIEAADGRRLLSIGSRYSSKKQKIAVTIRDTGVGIPPENLPKLFEPFFTTKKKGKGVGLGLSVAYGIIQEHGGAILVRSKLGEGTTFTVELPLKPPEKPSTTGTQGGSEKTP
jgi:PAS domain S-box-containing protein